jgi:hypothetical protein
MYVYLPSCVCIYDVRLCLTAHRPHLVRLCYPCCRQTIREQATANQEARSSPKRANTTNGKQLLPKLSRKTSLPLTAPDNDTPADSRVATSPVNLHAKARAPASQQLGPISSPGKPLGQEGASSATADLTNGITPQRRLHFLEVPVAASGALTKRVFEVRERAVEPCPKSQHIALPAPVLCHTTTELMIIRWQAENWSDAKDVVNYELQWCQPSLREGAQLMAYAVVAVAGAEGVGTTTEKVEFACDAHFCTVPRKAVRVIDARQEIVIQGLPSGCGPLFFRVRAKIAASKYEKDKPGGWCPWSPVSEAQQVRYPMRRTCD